MFEGFSEGRIEIGAGRTLFARWAGSGPAVVLLHGYPQSHAAWHAVAPRLAGDFTVVLPDLPGYGESQARPLDDQHAGASKRAMAEDILALMTELGHDRVMVAGHDRGGRVAYRMALDHPQRVARLAAVDLIPTLEVWAAMNAATALRGYHWLFLAQPRPLPERLIGGDPDFVLEQILRSWAGRRDALAPEAVAEYRRHFRRPEVLEAMCEDYRAGATRDREHDQTDRDGGRRIACPTLVLWARRYLSGLTRSPAEVWRRWADDVREVALDCGHFLPEEEPAACADALRAFFSG